MKILLLPKFNYVKIKEIKIKFQKINLYAQCFYMKSLRASVENRTFNHIAFERIVLKLEISTSLLKKQV